MNKLWILVAICLIGCSMPDEEVKEKAGNAAVEAKRAINYTSEQLRDAYNSARDEGAKLVESTQEKLSDAAIKAKILAGYKIIKGLDASKVEVTVKNGTVYLNGSVPTEMDRLKAEGVAYGVTGDGTKVRSALSVRQ